MEVGARPLLGLGLRTLISLDGRRLLRYSDSRFEENRHNEIGDDLVSTVVIRFAGRMRS